MERRDTGEMREPSEGYGEGEFVGWASKPSRAETLMPTPISREIFEEASLDDSIKMKTCFKTLIFFFKKIFFGNG